MEEVENDPTYSDEQRQLYRDRLDNLNTKKQAKSLTALSMTIATILLAIAGTLRGGGTGGSPPKDEGVLKKWLGKLSDVLKRLARRAVEALPAIVGSVVGAILSFLGKAVGFVAEHTWALIVFVVGLIVVWLMQRVKKD